MSFFAVMLIAAGLQPCGARPTAVEIPTVDSTRFCLEIVVADETAGELAFTALAAAPDGTLYAARPVSGEILAITDTDGDQLPDFARIAAEGLTLPNALAYHAGSLYIAGGAHLYRLTGNALEVLVDDLPSGSGFWTGGVAVGDDERVYVGIGAACTLCADARALEGNRGVILSFALDGTDRQVVAEGFRYPAGLAWADGALWTVDVAPADEGWPSVQVDELNRITPGHHYGFPYCAGQENTPLQAELPFDCSRASAPTQVFANGSTPFSIAPYTGSAFPELEGRFLVTLSGSYNSSTVRGYALVAVQPDDSRQQVALLLPYSPALNSTYPGRRSLGSLLDFAAVQFAGEALFPHRPYGVAVSAEGWIYVSAGGGTVYALRPASVNTP